LTFYFKKRSEKGSQTKEKVLDYSSRHSQILFLGGFVMSNKFDIIHEYQVVEAKLAELDQVCERISETNRGKHLLEAYDEKRQQLSAEKDRLGAILEAMSAAED
jgi:hypothetical protein